MPEITPQPIPQPPVKDVAKKQLKDFQYKIGPVQFHTHNNLDSPNVDISDVGRFPATPAWGDIPIYNATTRAWVSLTLGSTSGNFLQSSGLGTNPVWAAPVIPKILTVGNHALLDTSVPNNGTDVIVRSIANIPALATGDVMKVVTSGGLSTNAQAADILKLKVGASVLFTVAPGATTADMYFEINVAMRSGTSEYISGFGQVGIGNLTDLGGAAATSIDLTSSFTLDLVYNIPASDVTKTYTCKDFYVYIIKP